MDKQMTAPAPKPEEKDISPLNIDYDRFLPDEITDEDLRFPLNRAYGRNRGMLAIARILRASSVEKMAQSATHQALNQQDEQGLFDALVELAMANHTDITDLGEAIFCATSKDAAPC